MKKITKLLSLAAFVGFSFFSKAQNGIVYTSPSTTVNPCDGYAGLVDSNFYTPISWSDISNGLPTIIQTGGYQIYGLCPGTYSLEYTDSSGTATTTFFIDSINSNPCGAFQVSIYPTNTSVSGACDGSAIGVTSNGTPPFSYLWNTGQVIGQTTDQVLNLCAGSVSVTITDAAGCTGTSQVYIYGDSTVAVDFDGDGYDINYDCDDNNSSIYPGAIEIPNNNIDENCDGLDYSDSTVWNYDLSGYVYEYLPSADGACDGSAWIDVYGGTAPYTFENSNGDTTQNPQNLCSGIYSVFVTDANGDTLIINYVIANPSEVYYGGNYGDSTLVDSLDYGTIENCIIDYLTLDSAFISDIQYITNDSILVVWSVIDANGTINISQSYTISTGVGVYELILEIFCPQRSGTDYIYAVDRIYFSSGSALGTNELISSKELSIYPNPIQDILTIDLKENSEALVTITDISGKIVTSENVTNSICKISTSNFAKGQYFVNISSKEMNLTRMIIK